MQSLQTQQSSFYKDLYSLGRIVFAGLMASLTMLVVTVLLYEAVLADHATAVMTSHSGSFVSFPRDNVTSTTTTPAPPAPTALPYQHPRARDPDHIHRRKTFYRKNPKPFKPKRVKSDPYVFGDETDSQYQASDHFYEQKKKPKSIQEIISYLTENRPSKVMQSGLKFSGSFNHPHDVRDAKLDPVEEYRHSGDPAEVNSGLLGYSSPSPTRSIPNHVKPMPVSLLLDIYPANEGSRKKSRRRPSYPPSRLLSRPQHMVDSSNSYPVTGPYRPDAMDPPVMRDHEMRPSNPSRRPYSHARRDRDPKHHQIRLQLNFYPKKKQNGLYGRVQPNTRYGGIEDNKSILNSLNKQNSPSSVSTASSLWSPGGWSPSNWSPEDAVSSPAPISSTVLGLQPFELATDESSGFGKRLIPQNHRSHPPSRLQATSTTNASSLYGVVGSHGYTYELPTRLYFDHDEPPPEPRNE